MTNGPTGAFDNASAYEAYVGRWSRLVAPLFVKWLAIPPQSAWLDVGAGTGILTRIILEQASPRKIVGIDLSEFYVAFARRAIADPRVEFQVGDATQIEVEESSFDVAISGLVLNFVPSAEDAAQGMKRAVRPGGMVAAYVWDYGDRMEMMRQFWDAASAVDPAARAMDAGARMTLCDPDHLYALFASVGLENVDVRPIDIPTVFQGFDDFWTPFLGAQGSVSKYLRSLDEAKLDAIQTQLRQQLPIQDDESIHLTARAWAVKGRC